MVRAAVVLAVLLAATETRAGDASSDAKAGSAPASTTPAAPQRKVHCAKCDAWYVPPMSIAPDGGFYTLWIDRGLSAGDETLYLRRLTPAGTDAWKKYIPIASARRRAGAPVAIRDADIVPDGFGGVIVAWSAADQNDYNLYAQRVDDTGATYWDKPALPVCVAPKDQVHVQLMADRFGGAFFGWQDRRFENWDVFLQHVMPGGKPQDGWAPDGVQATFQSRDEFLTTLASDGLGGIWTTWWDQRTGKSDLFSLHLTDTGKPSMPRPYLWRRYD